MEPSYQRKLPPWEPEYQFANPVDSGRLHLMPPMRDPVTGIVSQDDVLSKGRWFVGEILKPHVMAWLSRLANEPKDKVCHNVSQALIRIQQSIDTCLKALESDSNTRIRVWEGVNEMLYPRHERAYIAQKLKPFLYSHYVHFRYYNLLDVYPNGKNPYPLEMDSLITLPPVGPLRAAEMEMYQHRYSQYQTAMINLCRSPVGISAELLSCALLAMYKALACAYIDHRIYVEDSEEEWYPGLVMKLCEKIEHWMECFRMAVQVDQIHRSGRRFVYEYIIDQLIEKIYDIVIVNFPSSYRTIFLLKDCMTMTEDYGRYRLVERLEQEINKKLLNVAVDTTVILSGYAACVESLRELDASCVLMHRVCKIIKDYLKKRPDTVRQIINYITSEKREDLAQHMKTKKRGTVVDGEEMNNANDDFLPEAMDMANWEAWTPDPPDAKPGESGRFRMAADVFNMLVSVYGSKEMFVREYRQLLAERLTMTDVKDAIFELRYLELLKLRFSEGELQQCEVMLKDIRDSLRVDNASMAKSCVPMNTCIVSSHFWPKIDVEKVTEFPPELEASLEQYAKTYKELKPTRYLNWMRSVGCVTVQLELDGVKVEKVVTNAQAAVLYLFLEKDGWTLADVCEKLGINKGVAKRRLEWWTVQGLLTQSLPTGATAEEWWLSTQPGSLEKARSGAEEETDEDELAIDEAVDAADGLEQYWAYTRNFISNHENGEVKAERIQRIFRMFASPASQGPSLETVNIFLMRKVKMNLLSFVNGSFRVVKEDPVANK